MSDHLPGVPACVKCDELRRRPGDRIHDLGKPCDICGGSGTDYIGRGCRHAPHSDEGNVR